MSSDKVGITGANGFIGSHVVRECIRRGMTVRALVLPGSSMRNLEPFRDSKQFQLVMGDLRNPQDVDTLIQGSRFVIHAGAYNQLWAADPNLPLLVNRDGTRHVLQACASYGVERLVHISSATLFQNPKKTQCDESDYLARAPGNAYEKSKWLADECVMNFVAEGGHALIVAPTVPIGAGEVFLSSPGRLILDFMQGKIPGYLESGFNVVDVEVLARTLCDCLNQGRNGERYLVGGENILFKEFFAHLSVLTKRPAPRFRVPYWVALTAAIVDETIATHMTHRPPRAPIEGVRLAKRPCFFSLTKAQTQLGLKPTQVRQALEKSVRFLSETFNVGL